MFDKVQDQMDRIIPYYKVKELVDRVLKESETSTKGWVIMGVELDIEGHPNYVVLHSESSWRSRCLIPIQD
jgi:hypothetical protein